jgi:Uncharacterized ACR, COG1678
MIPAAGVDRYTSTEHGYDDAMRQIETPSLPSAARALAGAAWLAVAAGVWGAGAHPAAAQELANGTLLVASPELPDPNFARSVVLVLRHDDNGTVGVVLNRPTSLEPAGVFPELATSVGDYTGRLFRGGPIAPSQLLFLVRGLAAATVSGPEVLDKVFLSLRRARRVGARAARGRDRRRRLAALARHAGARLPRRSRPPMDGARRAREPRRRSRRRG